VAAALVAAGYLFSAVPIAAQSAEVRAVVWKDEVYQGESFIYQVTVTGAESVRDPSTDPLEEFEPREIPRQWLWSYENDEYNPSDLPSGRHFFFRLMSPRTGNITIPSTTLFVDGRRRSTKPISITVSPPPEQEEFRLQLELSKTEIYVGEPVTLNAVWYARDSASFYFANIPLLRHPDVALSDREGGRGSAGLFLRMSGGSQRLSGTRGSAMLDGKQYQTLTLEQRLTMNASGAFEFPRATVQVWRTRRLGNRSRTYRGYEQTVVGSNQLSLTVNPLPIDGRPSDFTGIVSETLDVRTSLSHTEMNIGDPVTFRIELEGIPSPDNVQFPPLETFDDLASGFTLGPDDLTGEDDDDAAVFTQTIRVKEEGVNEVPPLEVSYFNTKTERYETARSAPIPITVRETRVLTVDDLEGGAAPNMQTTTVRDWKEGIRFNYVLEAGTPANDVVGLSLLSEAPLLIALLVAPMLFFFFVLIRNRRIAAASARAQAVAVPEPPPQQHDDPARRLTEIGPRDADTALSLLREYLAERLDLSPAERTIPETRAALERKAVDAELVEEVCSLLSEHESRRYWGGMLRNSESITQRVRELVPRMEEAL
jgi:hypothetical protein